jgi:predicted transcriptional regulator
MTELLEKVILQVRRLPEVEQNRVAEMLMHLVLQDEAVVLEELDPETLAAINEGLEQAERGEFATEAEMDALFRRYGA